MILTPKNRATRPVFYLTLRRDMGRTTQPQTESALAGPGSPQPEQAAPPPESGAAGSTAPALDPTLLDRFGQLIDQRLDEFGRKQQGLRAKQEQRIDQRLNGFLETLKAVGVTPTDDQVQALRVRAQAEEAAEPAQPTPAAPAPAPAQPAAEPAAPAQQPEAQALQDLAYSFMDAFKVDIEENDPEAKLIDWSSKDSVIRTVNDAIAAKRARAARNQLPLAGGPGNPNPIATITDPQELLKRGLAKLK